MALCFNNNNNTKEHIYLCRGLPRYIDKFRTYFFVVLFYCCAHKYTNFMLFCLIHHMYNWEARIMCLSLPAFVSQQLLYSFVIKRDFLLLLSALVFLEFFFLYLNTKNKQKTNNRHSVLFHRNDEFALCLPIILLMHHSLE